MVTTQSDQCETKDAQAHLSLVYGPEVGRPGIDEVGRMAMEILLMEVRDICLLSLMLTMLFGMVRRRMEAGGDRQRLTMEVG